MNAIEKYNNANANNSNSMQQLTFIFDEIVKNLYKARKAIDNKEYEQKYRTLAKVIDVFYILRSGIDEENMDDNTKAVYNFYIATTERLEAISINDKKPLEELDIVINAINEVRAALLEVSAL